MAIVAKKSDDDVNWRSLDQTIRRVQEAFADLSADELKSLIDKAIASVRRQKYREGNFGSGK